ncbi:MAG: hypothetical protein EU550_01435 [Promethearchaeota archaeon]|nr:MAG: hypothetical protein EU550_01435 [Candidatus Lokiarchaeota archaeon]
MLTDLLQSIYNRIAGLGKSIQDLKASLDSLNANIEEKITKLTTKISEFSKEIEVTQTKHIEALKDIGDGVNQELSKMLGGLGLEDMEKLIENLENFSTLASEVLNQDTVNLLLSEAISSVKTLKSSMTKEE